MNKPLLLSVVMATLVVPLIAGRIRKPMRGLAVAVALIALFNLVYLAALALFIRSPF